MRALRQRQTHVSSWRQQQSPRPRLPKLYTLQLDVGGNETRQVVAGLKMFVPAGQLLDSLVVAILNLKPAKLAGVMSEVSTNQGYMQMVLTAHGLEDRDSCTVT